MDLEEAVFEPMPLVCFGAERLEEIEPNFCFHADLVSTILNLPCWSQQLHKEIEDAGPMDELDFIEHSLFTKYEDVDLPSNRQDGGRCWVIPANTTAVMLENTSSPSETASAQRTTLLLRPENVLLNDAAAPTSTPEAAMISPNAAAVTLKLDVRTSKTLMQDLDLLPPAPPPQPAKEDELIAELFCAVRIKLELAAETEAEEDPAQIRAKVRQLSNHGSSTGRSPELAYNVKLHLFVVAKALVVETPALCEQYLEFCQANAQYRAALGSSCDQVFAILLHDLCKSSLFARNKTIEQQRRVPNGEAPRELIPTRILVNAAQVCQSADVRKVVALLQQDWRVTCLERSNLAHGNGGSGAELEQNGGPVTFCLDADSACVLASFPMSNSTAPATWASLLCKWFVYQGRQAYDNLLFVLLLHSPKPDAACRAAVRNLAATLAMLGKAASSSTTCKRAPIAHLRLASNCNEAAQHIRAFIDDQVAPSQQQQQQQQAHYFGNDWYRARDHFPENADDVLDAQISLLCSFPGITPCLAEQICLQQQAHSSSLAQFIAQQTEFEAIRQIAHAFLMPAVAAAAPLEEQEPEDYSFDARPVNTLRFEKDANGSTQTRLVWRPKV